MAYTIATPVRYLNSLDFSCNNFIIGEGKQYAIKSWWPTDSTWNANTSHSHWTEMAEGFYDKRLGELQAEKPLPLDAQSWRKRIRAPSHMRRVNAFVSSSSAAFLGSLPVKSF